MAATPSAFPHASRRQLVVALASILDELKSRLPEIEWALSMISPHFSKQLLPRGLFRYSETDASGYIDEVRVDLVRLAQEKNALIAEHLAKTIEQKINVLVLLCCQNLDKKAQVREDSFILDTITTRKEWYKNLEQKKASLTAQRDALCHTLKRKNSVDLKEEGFVLQAALGDIEKQLTLVQEKISELMFGVVR